MNDKQQLAALGDFMQQLADFKDWRLAHASKKPHAKRSVTRQRDELLAALEALVTIVADTRHPDPDDVYAVIAEARETINQVRNEI